MTNLQSTITLTYSEVCENHHGMQKIGTLSKCGLSSDDLKSLQEKFEKDGYKCLLVNLNDLLNETSYKCDENASILIVKGGIGSLLSNSNYSYDDLLKEQNSLEPDTKYYSYGMVRNKKARYNLCFSDFSQKPDYANKKGTVIDFKNIPVTAECRKKLSSLNDKLKLLYAEGNYYYDLRKTYIGFHGDTERRIVIGLRLGSKMPIYFQWYTHCNEIGKLFQYDLEGGDIYFMNDKATGFDWKKRNSITLRHAAGCIALKMKK